MRKVSKYDLVNLSNSLLKHYGVEMFHDSIPELDEALKGHKKVVFMLFDGMGKNITRMHLTESSYIRSNYRFTIDSTFPPTTAAATTAFLTGKYPVETGWTAWDAYFKKLDRNVILFLNIDYNNEEKLTDNYVRDAIKYESIIDLINKKDPSNNARIMQRYPINLDGPKDLNDSYNMLNNVLKNNNKCFIYYYYDSPDKEMHENGIDVPIIKDTCEQINDFVEKITKENPDTFFITFADHGHINPKYLDICDHPELCTMLRKNVGGEKRSTQFFVKPECLKSFKELFLKIYGEHFELVSKEEVYKEELFGVGTPHPLFDDMLGDYLAISKDEYSLLARDQFVRMEILKGHHAGGTIDEKLIDVSFYNI